MENETNSTEEPAVDDFEKQARQEQPGLLREMWESVKYNKKWFLIPVIAVLLLASVLIVLAGTGAAPFIYALF